MKKKIIIIITLLMLILTPFLINKNNKIVKAEIKGSYKIAIPNTISKNNITLLKQNALTINNNANQYLFIGIDSNQNEFKIYKMEITESYDNPPYPRVSLRYLYSDNTTPITSQIRYYNYNSETQEYEFTNYYENADGMNIAHITDTELVTIEWETTTEFINKYNQNESAINIWINSGILVEIENTIQLQTPTLTINLNTLHWQEIENANYYNIFMNGNLIGQTQNTQWVTIENGIYTVQACTTQEGYTNSEISNSITQNNYNDMIGNGVNWFTLMSAIIDSQIYLMKSMLNYTIWDINFFQLFTFVITIIITLAIIKFIKGW